MDKDWRNHWLNIGPDMRPTSFRPLIHQDDPRERDAALKRFTVSGINTVLPIALASISGPISLPSVISMLGHSAREEYERPKENIVAGDKLENLYNMNKEIQQGKPVDLYQKFKEIILGGMFSH